MSHQQEYPVVGVNGEELTVRRDADVRTAFEGQTGITEGASLGEFTVETMDCELDYDYGEDSDVLRVHVYLNPVTPDGMSAHVKEEALSLTGWTKESYMAGSGTFGVVYEAEDWVFL